MNQTQKSAFESHRQVPPNWYFESLKVDPFQRYWHRRRFDEVAKLIEPVKGAILDIGCADGMFSKILLDKSGAEKLVGIDILKTSVDWANAHWKETSRMQFMVGDAHELKFKDGTFEAVFALEVLEHVHEPIQILREIKRILIKDGYAVFLVPSDNFLFRTVWFLWLHFYPRGWVWRETHIQSFQNDYLPEACKKAGFKVVSNMKFILGMLHLVKVRK